jgi:hypothetical protein
MKSQPLTRRSFVIGSVASAVGVGLDEAGADAFASDPNLVVGRFVEAGGPRSGTMTIASGRSIAVTLDPAAFVMHGTEGVVHSMATFVPGEEVVVRGEASDGGIRAVELQSLYTRVTGTVADDGDGKILVTRSGTRVRIPKEVAQRKMPSGLRNGSAYSATVWTHPSTGKATAVDLGTEA